MLLGTTMCLPWFSFWGSRSRQIAQRMQRYCSTAIWKTAVLWPVNYCDCWRGKKVLKKKKKQKTEKLPENSPYVQRPQKVQCQNLPGPSTAQGRAASFPDDPSHHVPQDGAALHFQAHASAHVLPQAITQRCSAVLQPHCVYHRDRTVGSRALSGLSCPVPPPLRLPPPSSWE